jgi:hypothetical protein
MIPAENVLAEIIPPNKQLTFVEVGTLRATTLVKLAEQFPLVTFIGVDNYQPYVDPLHGDYTVTTTMSNYNKYIAEKNIRNSPHSDRISLWLKDSSQAAKEIADQSLGVVFLDKSFTKEIAKQDVFEWFPKVKDGGILAGHEADTEEVFSAATEVLGLYGLENSIKVTADVWYVIVNRNIKK